MGFLDRLVIGGGLALVSTAAAFVFKSARETAKRKSTPAEFEAWMTESDFREIVRQIGQKTPRLISATADGLLVHIIVRSNSGLSLWSAELDFNDYGHATGQYWISTENKQSPIPEFFAKAIQEEVLRRKT